MSTLHLVGLIGIFILAALAIIYFFFPDQPVSFRKRKKEPRPVPADNKNWEEANRKLEKHIFSLRGEIEKLKLSERNLSRDVAVEKEKNTRLQEKLFQEKKWLDKEKDSMEKSAGELKSLKENLIKVQNDQEKEHSLNLKYEREIKDLKKGLEDLEKERRDTAAKLMQAESELTVYKKELAEQKRLNQELKKETNEVQWIARSEYEKIEKLLKEKEKELQNIKRLPS